MNKTIDKVLMCRPSHYSVEYVINPWMKPGTVDPKKALEQWESIVKAYEHAGILVQVIDQVKGLPDMVFATDQGIVQGREVVLSNFRCKERQGESEHYEKWFKDSGYIIKKIRQGEFFEGGGEVLAWRNIFFMGTGFRSIPESVAPLSTRLGKKIIPLHLINPLFYHLDTCLFPLNDETIFYYPEALSEESITILKNTVPNYFELTHDEAFNFCTNSVVSGRNVFVQKGSKTFNKKLETIGYKVVELDVSEFIKAGGGIHCLTNILN